MSTGPKQALYAEFAVVARALGSAHRLEILEHLAQGERGVDLLAERVGLSIANASQHLQQLKRAGMVTSRRDGKFVLHRLADDRVLDLMHALFDIGERNVAEVDQIIRRYFSARDSMEPVSREELVRRSRDGLVTILDCPPARRIQGGASAGRRQHSLGRSRNPPRRTRSRTRDRCLLSRRLLHLVLRGCRGAAPPRLCRATAQRRLSGVEGDRPAGEPSDLTNRPPKETAMRTLLILNDAPYGTERVYNGLRLAQALGKHAPEGTVTVFLMADAVLSARAGQRPLTATTTSRRCSNGSPPSEARCSSAEPAWTRAACRPTK